MKKLFLLAFTLVLPRAIQPIDLTTALRFVSEKIHSTLPYVDATKITTIFLGIGVATLLIDKIYPIFPLRKPQPLIIPGNTLNYNRIITEEMQHFSQNTLNPAIQALGDRISLLQNNEPLGITSEKINSLEKGFEHLQTYIETLPDILKSYERRITKHEDALVGYVDAEKTLRIFQMKLSAIKLELQEYQKTADSINSYLEMLNQKSPRISSSSPRTSCQFSDIVLEEFTPPDSPRSDEDVQQKKHPVPPLNLNSSAHLHAQDISPISPSEAPYVYSNQINN